MTRALLVILTLALSLISLGPASAGDTFFAIVNVNTDASDNNIADTNCDSSLDPGPQCSLRAALEENIDEGLPGAIHFNLPGSLEIMVTGTELPPIVNPLLIDGTTQACASYPCVVINGSLLGSSSDGLTVQADDSEIRGLVINQFNLGIQLPLGADGNTVAGNYVGTDATGMMNLGNYNGIELRGSSNTIGGPAAEDRNVVVGYTGRGIDVDGEFASQNVITNNYVGVAADGETPMGGSVGVFMRDDQTSGRSRVAPAGEGEDNFVGPGNVISGNQGGGIYTQGDGTVIVGNRIGTDASGQFAVPNGGDGIELHGDGNTIGGDSATERNIISGNAGHGVSISPHDLSTAIGNVVQGNYIGTNAGGTSAIPNGSQGIGIQDAEFTTIGGEGGARNVISGNLANGIGAGNASVLNIVGNYVGTNASGQGAIGNGIQGISLVGVQSSTQVTGNLVSGNLNTGINIGYQADGAGIFSNRVGVSASGGPLGNGNHGIFIRDSLDNIVGADGDKDPFGSLGNTIAHNGGNGVMVTTDGHPSTGNTIVYNSIFSNALKGIETSAGGNNELPPPVIGALRAGMTIDGTACANCTIDLYSDDEDEGRIHEASVVADGSGTWSYIEAVAGPFTTATATDAGGNTSEFSAPVISPVAPTPTPTIEPTATPIPTPTSTPGPSETPGPTDTPEPTGTPSGKALQGDTDCDEDADSVDALFVLRDVAGFEPSKCIDSGDVDCDEDRDSVDGLGILRYVAALPPLAQQEPCADIGTPL